VCVCIKQTRIISEGTQDMHGIIASLLKRIHNLTDDERK